MEVTFTIPQLINESLKNAYSYEEYRVLIADLIKESKSTGHTQTEALLEYSILNDRRMKRWDKTLNIAPEIIEKVENTNTKITWVVLTEGWCGDAAHILPVMNRLASLTDKIDLKVISRDDHDELMGHFLTNGGKSIPKLIAYDEDTQEVAGTWGPRPSIATALVDDYKKEHGALDATFKQDLQVWYNKNKGQDIAEDLVNLIS